MAEMVKNQITFTGDQRDINEMFAEIIHITDDCEDGWFDFNRIVPMPESLTDVEEISGMESEWLFYTEIGNDAKAEEALERLRAFIHFIKQPTEKDIAKYKAKRPDFMVTGRHYANNRALYGCVDKKTWIRTQWGADESYETFYVAGKPEDRPIDNPGNYLDFKTKWEPPAGIIRALPKLYPEIGFQWRYADEAWATGTGKAVYSPKRPDKGAVIITFPDGSPSAEIISETVWGPYEDD